MGHAKGHLLSRLEELQISFSKYDHPFVVTVEAQARYIGHLKGALSKNLFLKDKKQRFYIVSALVETKVDLKVLSQRLGLGKGGLRMAPEEAITKILQVPLGCVTPFALINESARHVSLLLDRGFKTQECCFFHPLSNDTSISLKACDLDKFLISVGKTPAYVDLEANTSVGKDQPPDLATLVPSDMTTMFEIPEKAGASGSFENDNNTKSTSIEAVKISEGPAKVNPVEKATSFANPGTFVEEIIEKVTSMVISETRDGNTEKHQEHLTFLSDGIRKQLEVELKNTAAIFKNTAYTEGFIAGVRHQQKKL